MPFYRCSTINGSGSGGDTDNLYLKVVGYDYDDYPSLYPNAILENGYKEYLNTHYRINICNQISSCSRLFQGINYEYPVSIPISVRDVSYLLGGCTEFNQPVYLGGNALNASYVLYNTPNFNSEVILGVNCYNLNSAFKASGFNRPIVINMSGASDCRGMFSASRHNSPVLFRLKSSTVNFYQAFFSSNIENYNYMRNRTADIIIDLSQNASAGYVAYSMLNNHDPSVRINVYSQNVTNLLNGTRGYSVTGDVMTWTGTTNGYYCAAYNIYALTNVADALTKFNQAYYDVYGRYPEY